MWEHSGLTHSDALILDIKDQVTCGAAGGIRNYVGCVFLFFFTSNAVFFFFFTSNAVFLRKPVPEGIRVCVI